MRHGGVFLGLILGVPLGSALTLVNLGLAVGMVDGLRAQRLEGDLHKLRDDIREPLLTVPSHVGPLEPGWSDAAPEPPLVPPIFEAPDPGLPAPDGPPAEPPARRGTPRDFANAR